MNKPGPTGREMAARLLARMAPDHASPPAAARTRPALTARPFDLFRLPAATPFMELAWDALESSSFLSDLHRECGVLNKRANRIVIAEERWRRPHHCPGRYTFRENNTVTQMQLELAPNELRLVFRTGDAPTKSRWRSAPAASSEPIRRVREERRLVLSLGALDNVPVRDCLGYLLSGMPREGWLRLCGGADVKASGAADANGDTLPASAAPSPAVAT